ncbi:MAG: RsmE family RNA methyltransferase [Bacteroidota bacterium]
MNFFYSNQVGPDSIVLDDIEANHASRVLRLRVGDSVGVLDGKGFEYKCEILSLSPKQGLLRIVSSKKIPPQVKSINLAVSPTKSSDRFEWFVEKASEIGVNRIFPIFSERTERNRINMDRVNKLIISSCKQSMNPWFPVIEEPQTFDDFLSISETGMIAHCLEGFKTEISNFDTISKLNPTVLIGPEGDFTPTEVARALSLGWLPITLGSNRLRTETAALYAALTLVIMRNNNYNK